MKTITAGGIFVRFLLAFALVACTWNPTRYNFVQWALAQWDANAAIVFFVGVALLIGWVVFLGTTARSLGPVGIFLAMAFAGAVFWVLFRYGFVDGQRTQLLGWVVLLLFSGILAIGMSWSLLRRGWTGQADVRDVDGD